MSLRVSASLLVPPLKSKTSSTKRRCVRDRVCEILIPKSSPELLLCERALLSPSATRRKRSGDKGKPYLSPLPGVKKGEAEPFIRTAKDAEVRQLIIHVMNDTSKPK